MRKCDYCQVKEYHDGRKSLLVFHDRCDLVPVTMEIEENKIVLYKTLKLIKINECEIKFCPMCGQLLEVKK